MVRDIRITEHWLGEEDLYIDKSVLSAKIKLERSIATLHDMKEGDIIRKEDLHMLSPGDGYKWDQLDEIVGKKLTKSIPANEIIYPKDIE